MKSLASLTRTGLALAVLLIASTAGPAAADTLRKPDGLGDVWEVIDSGAAPAEPAERVINVDLEKVTVRVGQRIVVVRGFYSDLFDNGGDSTEFWLELKSNKWSYRTVSLMTDPSDPGGSVRLTDEAGEPMVCAGLNHFVDRDLDRASMRIPIRCLGRPAWLRHKAWAKTITEEGGWFVDPAGPLEAEHAAWSRKITRG